jgi:hypothetical protein
MWGSGLGIFFNAFLKLVFMENLIRYAISPVAFLLLFVVGLVVGSVFIAIGTVSYIKLIAANRRIGFF